MTPTELRYFLSMHLTTPSCLKHVPWRIPHPLSRFERFILGLDQVHNKFQLVSRLNPLGCSFYSFLQRALFKMLKTSGLVEVTRNSLSDAFTSIRSLHQSHSIPSGLLWRLWMITFVVQHLSFISWLRAIILSTNMELIFHWLYI